ncbi:alanine--tRNA ligase [Papillibacter cinnamivorans]|uniref:Alanine--tRNA ligase n=1 Tax=Papillibacter cinnamivorans DSM 12816 TaxID=1122930 RepID=A0A1W1ZHF1_9FIRM|nr:alanine--tRNA ligase [Papillibacter cinnamivorans]SMC47803.1 alanyl-tRNA synthetase [Papillibacter cinnamivorans DSM 12816]
MEQLGLNELREKFLTFFESKGHLRHPSFPLVPQGDSSLLLINSGMAPLKPYFSGEVTPPRKRMTTCQKCIRTPDIERVGKTARHGTFFEMLGNFSFGDYFKREATAWAWEFITQVLEIPTDKLYVSVYQDDDEAYDIWTKEVGVKPSHMVRLGKEDNFWEIGAGPCGPCSEIYFDRGEKYGCDRPECFVGCDCDRYVEFWNLVFTQFNNDGNGNYTPLKQKNIDTGMGLERLACIMQNVYSLFDVDTIRNITAHVSEITGAVYGQSDNKDVSLRVITDHIRSTTMMVCDGVLPSNEGRGYVLRRLLRRAARHGRLLGVTRPFLYEVAGTVIRESRGAYPELEEKRDYITRIIRAEEERFSQTIDAGLKILLDMIEDEKKHRSAVLNGADAFRLYDTYGFPIDLTVEILEEQGMSADREGFDKLMDEQKARARAATAALGDFAWVGLDLGLDKDLKTEFTGYTEFESPAKVLAIAAENELRSTAYTGESAVVVLDRTPFYAEMGGQTADTGTICAGDMVFEVSDVHKSKDGKYMHSGKVIQGQIRVDEAVTAKIDAERRRAIMRAHSSTHLLQKALRSVLGTHVEQAGSLVQPDVLRFDFTHFSAVTPGELHTIEREVNRAILAGMPVRVDEMPIAEAKKLGAMALFGEKYGDVVRVVRMGDYSTELCGGTHLDNTAKAGLFRIGSEFSVASGVRRIEATVGVASIESVEHDEEILKQAAELLKSTPADLPVRAAQQTEELRELRRQLERQQAKQTLGKAEELLSSAKPVGELKVLTAGLSQVDADTLRKMGDFLRDKEDGIVAVLASRGEDKLTFLAVCGKKAVESGIKAGDLIRTVTKLAGGSGGGKPDIAMGGGKDPALMEKALSAVEEFVQAGIKK